MGVSNYSFLNSATYLASRQVMINQGYSISSLEHAFKHTYTIVPYSTKYKIHILGLDMTLEYVIIVADITGKILYQEENILRKNAEHNSSSLPTDLYIVALQIDKQSYFVKRENN